MALDKVGQPVKRAQHVGVDHSPILLSTTNFHAERRHHDIEPIRWFVTRDLKLDSWGLLRGPEKRNS